MWCTLVCMSTYEPGIYVKGDQTLRADTKADAVAAEFRGFKRQSDVEPEAVEPEVDVVDETDEDERPAEVNGHEDPFDHFDA